MKTFFQILLTLLVLASCAPEKVKLELNLNPGEVYKQRLTSKMSVSQTINGRKSFMGMTVSGLMAYKVLGVQDSVYQMQVVYQHLTMKMDLPNGVREFSSEKKDTTDIFSTLLAVMKNNPFYVKMDRFGKILEVKNIDSLFVNMFVKFPQLPEERKIQIVNQLKEAYGEKAFKGNIEMVTALYPRNAVGKGDKWNVKTELEAGFAGNMDAEYQLKESADEYFLVSGNSKLSTADKDAYIEVNGMPVKYDMKGTITSEIKLSRKTGWIASAHLSQFIQGVAYIKDNEQMPGGMAIPTAIGNEMAIIDK